MLHNSNQIYRRTCHCWPELNKRLAFGNQFILFRVVVDPEPILETLGSRRDYIWYILDRTLVHRRLLYKHAHTHLGAIVANLPTGMFFGELENLDETRVNTGKTCLQVLFGSVSRLSSQHLSLSVYNDNMINTDNVRDFIEKSITFWCHHGDLSFFNSVYD